jgi:hypothetical protein
MKIDGDELALQDSSLLMTDIVVPSPIFTLRLANSPRLKPDM